MSFAEREPRKAVALEVELKDFTFTNISADSSTNLSRGGAFIKMDSPHRTGTLIKFAMKVAAGKEINGVARVVWARERETAELGPAGVGIKFVKLDAESKALLDEVLAGAQEAPASPSAQPRAASPSAAPKAAAGRPRSIPPTVGHKRSSTPTKASTPPGRLSQSPPKPSTAPPSASLRSSSAPATASRPAPLPEAEPAPEPPRRPLLDDADAAAAPAQKRARDTAETDADAVAPIAPPTEEERPEAGQEGSRSDGQAQDHPDAPRQSTSMPERSSRSDAPLAPSGEGKTVAARPAGNGVLYAILGLALVAGIAFLLMKNTGGAAGPSDEAPSQAVAVAPADRSSPAEPAAGGEDPTAVAPDTPTPSEKGAGPADTAAADTADGTDTAPTREGADTDAAPGDPASAAADTADGTDTAPTREGADTDVAPGDPAAADEAAPATADTAGTPAATEAASLEVKTAPPGAAVLLNGVEVAGQTPLTLNTLRVGEPAEVTVRLKGFTTETHTIDPKEKENTLDLALNVARVKFKMTSTPPGARILIDGKFNGKTPFTFMRARYKPEFKYRLEKRRYEPFEGTITPDDWVEEGRFHVFTLDATLEPKAKD